jgi:hypothetical protein
MRYLTMIIIILATMVVAHSELGPDAGTPAIQQEIVQQQIVLRQYICKGDKAGIRRIQNKISSLNERLNKLESKVSVHGKMLHDQDGRIVSLEENRKGYLTEDKADALYQPIVASDSPAPGSAIITPPPSAQPNGTTAQTESEQPVTPAGEKKMENALIWLAANWFWLVIIGIVVFLLVRINLAGLLADLFQSWDGRTFGGGSTSSFEASGRIGNTRWAWKEKKNTP